MVPPVTVITTAPLGSLTAMAEVSRRPPGSPASVARASNV